VMLLGPFVPLCCLASTVFDGESGVACRCFDPSNTWSFPSARGDVVLEGLGLGFCVGKKRVSDDSAPSDSGDEIGVLS
jgi:hypothetical protein